MASTARIDELKKKFDENPRRYFAPLANEFRKMGDLEQAIMICEEFLPQQPGHMSGHIVYGQALYESGKLPESRAVFETALGLDPENLIALRHLGDIARSQGDLGDARRWYDRVLEADPRNDEIQGVIASLSAAPPHVPETPAGAPPPREVVMQPAVPALPVMRPLAPPPDVTPIDLEMDESVFGQTDVQVDIREPAVPLPSAQPDRAEGLVSAEFEIPTESTPRAEGLEPSEFEAPAAPAPRAEGLEPSTFESPAPPPTSGSLLELDSTVSPVVAATVAPLPGLEETGSTQPVSALPDFGTAAEPTVLVSTAAAAPTGMQAMNELDLGEPEPMPTPSESEPPRPDAAAIEAAAVAGLPMMELTPSVIAAEAVLIESGATLATSDAATDSNERLAPTATPPFVTETMAELYLKQGFRDEALAVYRQLSEASPGDTRLRARVAELEPEPEPVEKGPTVREFFARLAALRPGERAAAEVPPSNDDFAAFDAVPAPQPVAATELAAERAALAPVSRVTPTGMSSGTERGAAAQGGGPTGGTIDALFGNRTVGKSEDSAASALAQAFSGSSPSSPISGRPARAASGELSLDSVFRDGPARPPRTSQSFSFDQFFAESAAESAPAPAPGKATPVESPAQGEPASRGADDIQQFNSWLQGLKQK
jgi:hypothetical protein